MKRAAVLLFVAALVLAGISPANAEAIRKWSVEPAIHGGFVSLDADLKADDTTFTGASLSLTVHPAFQVEAISTTFSTESSLGASGNDYKQEMVGLRLIGTFLADQDVRTMPYIAAGGGKIKSTGDPGGNATKTFEEEASYAEVAFGARVFVWKGFNVRPELGLQHSRTIDEIGRDRTHTNFHFTVGLSWFLFGSK